MMMDVCKRVLFWGWFAAALALDVLVLKKAPPRAAVLLLTGHVIAAAWGSFCLVLTVRPSAEGDDEKADDAEDSRH